tara:strand:+ start:112628 stop:112975 length:348 start_codon:yes stop_codon:yes gene_type:complete
MSEVFVIRNQLGHYWGKSKAWVDGGDARAVMRVKHQDEAVNTLVELGSKDYELRGEVIAAPLSEKGEPVIERSQIPLELEETPEVESNAAETAQEPAGAESDEAASSQLAQETDA